MAKCFGAKDAMGLREVEGHVEVVVLEGLVLLRVQELEERGRGVAEGALRELVDLVEQDHRILHA